MRELQSFPSARLAIFIVIAATILAGCGGDDDLQVLRTCGNGQVEGGEECDDGGICVGGLNPRGSCLIGEPNSCPGFTGSCSLSPAVPDTCQGGALDGQACSRDQDCCPDDEPDCGVLCGGAAQGAGGFCRGGPLDGANCGSDAQCCPGGIAGCGVRCIGTCLGGPNDGADCTGDVSCSVGAGVCTLVDTDSCTSVCRLPTCGDGVINPGLEQCENFDLGGATCADLGLGQGRLACNDDCRFDATDCGAPFTATPTDTPLPTATGTPTPTNTFMPGFTPPTATPSDTPTPSPTSTPDDGPECGNGLLEITENFPDPNPVIGVVGDQGGFPCEEDAIVQDCQPSAEQFAVQVNLSAIPPAAVITGISVFTGYRSDVLSLPGTGLAGTVRQRVQLLVPASNFFPNDRDFGLRSLMTGTEPLEEGPFATVTFDVCDGVIATIEDISCIVETATGTGGQVPGAECEISEVDQ